MRRTASPLIASTALTVLALIVIFTNCAQAAPRRHYNHSLDRALWTASETYQKASLLDCLKRGADPNAKGPDGSTPLMNAAHFGQITMVSALIRYGADVNAHDPTGQTALMLASRSALSTPQTVKLLLQDGAAVNAVDNTGETALDGANYFKDASAAQILEAAGGKAHRYSFGGSTATTTVASNPPPIPASQAAPAPIPVAAAPPVSTPASVVYGGKEIGYYYKGQYADVVKTLLDGAPTWRTPQSNTPDGIAACQMPTFSDLATFGQRDQYVAAAVLDAFQMETYARLGTPDKANAVAPAMMANLKSARDLCSDDQAALQGSPPATLSYVTCDWLKSLNYP